MSEYPETTNGASPQSPHLTDELLAAWAADELAGDARGAVQRHLESCAYCQSALAETQRIRTLARASANSAGAPMASASVVEHVLARLPDASNAPAASSREQQREGASAPRTRAARNRRRSAWRRVGALAVVLLLVASSAVLFSRISSRGQLVNPTPTAGPPGVANIPGNWANVLPPGSWVSDTAVVSPTDIWAAGRVISAGTVKTLLAHFDGKRWQISPDYFLNAGLSSISMVSASEGWAVGTASSNQPFMLHYTDGHWRDATATIDTETPTTHSLVLFQVRMASATAGWALGQQGDQQSTQIMQYLKIGDAYRWEPVISFAGVYLNALSVVSDHEVWMVGTNGDKTFLARTTITYLNNDPSSTITNWNTHSWDVGPGGLNAISMLSSTDGWAAGATDTLQGILFHWDGQQWRQVDFQPYGQQLGPLEGVVMTAPNTGWVYGMSADSNDSVIYSLTNGQWSTYPPVVGKDIEVGAIVTPTTLFIVSQIPDKSQLPVPAIVDMKDGAPIK
jgi:hypothetical protein